MYLESITSPQNAALKRARKAADGEEWCLAEGPKLIRELIRAGIEPDFLLIDEERKERHEQLLRERSFSSTRKLSVAAKLFNSISDTVTSQGILACMKTPEVPELTSLEDKLELFVACDAIQDPGNLGTIIRSALAFSNKAAVLLPGCARPFSAKLIRASAGAVFHLPIFKANAGSLAEYCRRQDNQILALDASADRSIGSYTAEKPCLLIGNEGHGFSADVHAIVEIWLSIPIDERGESLNAAVAASIGMYQLRSGRKEGTR